MDGISETLSRHAPQFGVRLTKDALRAFSQYYEQLELRNRVMNLTAITDKDSAGVLHFLDSLSLFLTSDFKGMSVIDIGSGAGFPGIPIKLAEPTSNVTLLDATRKRITFLSELCVSLGLYDISCIHGRAEEVSHNTEFREVFDIAVSRAVARLNVLCELCLPFVKPGGYFLAMKGSHYIEELSESNAAIEKLGGKLIRSVTYTLPETEITHAIIVIEKVSNSSSIYPRRFSKLQKSPL